MNIQGFDIQIKHIDIAASISCNLKCKMCGYREVVINDKGLKKEDILRMLSEAKELGLESIAFSGGEVLLRSDIFEIVSFAKELKIGEISIVTNGTLVTEENTRRLIECGATDFHVSLEGMEPVNDYLRGEDTFKKSINAIKIFKEYEGRISIHTNTVISRLNYRTLFEFTRYVYEELGVRSITYSPLNTDMMGSNLEKYRDELVVQPYEIPAVTEEIQKIISYSRQKGICFQPESYLSRIPDFFAGKRLIPRQPCHIPLEYLGIDSCGNVFPCWSEYLCVGNITKSSLTDIVSSETFLKLCEKALAKKCKGCLVSCYSYVYEEQTQGEVECV